MTDEKETLALADALDIKDRYYPFSLLDDAQFDYWIADERGTPEEGENQKAIRAALLILKPKPSERAKCCETIRYAIGTVNRAEAEQNIRSPRSKNSEDAIEQLIGSLNKARVARKKLPPLEQIRFDKVFELAGAIEFCERVTREWENKSMPRARTSHRQRAAVEMARKLLDYWLVKKMGLHEAVLLTRKNEWHRLSSILFGSPRVDLLAHMMRYERRSRKPVAK
jgi:hypothetical protein